MNIRVEMKRSAAVFGIIVLALVCLSGPVLAAIPIPIEGRILDMKKTFSLVGKLLNGTKAVALERITVEIVRADLPNYQNVHTDSKEHDKAVLEFVKLNAKEIDLQTFGRQFLGTSEGLPYFELEKYFGDFKKGREIKFKGSVFGELKKNNTYEVTLRYINEIKVDGKVVFSK